MLGSIWPQPAGLVYCSYLFRSIWLWVKKKTPRENHRFWLIFPFTDGVYPNKPQVLVYFSLYQTGVFRVDPQPAMWSPTEARWEEAENFAMRLLDTSGPEKERIPIRAKKNQRGDFCAVKPLFYLGKTMVFLDKTRIFPILVLTLLGLLRDKQL